MSTITTTRHVLVPGAHRCRVPGANPHLYEGPSLLQAGAECTTRRDTSTSGDTSGPDVKVLRGEFNRRSLSLLASGLSCAMIQARTTRGGW
jgi:hypothetical protein